MDPYFWHSGIGRIFMVTSLTTPRVPDQKKTKIHFCKQYKLDFIKRQPRGRYVWGLLLPNMWCIYMYFALWKRSCSLTTRPILYYDNVNQHTNKKTHLLNLGPYDVYQVPSKSYEPNSSFPVPHAVLHIWSAPLNLRCFHRRSSSYL